ncbi:MAG: disulfide bond formation protein DsbA [Burkholderiales bacterium PBB4]|nr:MAG: disulfide bond formation protein DsbA [Burkholderiales bacterium PBB4]
MKPNCAPGWSAGNAPRSQSSIHQSLLEPPVGQPAIQFMFDFGSPNAYLCHQVLPAIEERTGVSFEYVPVLLGGLFKLANNRSPMEAFAGIPNKQAYDRLEMQRFVKKHKIEHFKFNPFFPINTLLLMRGAVAAQKLGYLQSYVDVIYQAMWERSLNMGDASEVLAVLSAAGMDAGALLEAAQHADVKSTLLANTQSAFERGAFGSPTFFVGNEMFFGKDRLEQVEEEIVCRASDALLRPGCTPSANSARKESSGHSLPGVQGSGEPHLSSESF